ncbi:MAG: lytic transglycosylase domain-containing protein [Deltaproteobacteria bacterium]|nr:lytic transglycosylase domain-containing protein [Deltaproteobacteria bacterium]
MTITKIIFLSLIFANCVLQTRLQADIFDGPSSKFNLPKNLLIAISKVESDLNPWPLNIEGKSYYFDYRDDAIYWANNAFNSGRSFDLGLMQINSYWLKKFRVSPEAALDPLANIYFGGWILNQEYKRLGDIKKAIGSYHSPSPDKANNYVRVVLDALEKQGPALDYPSYSSFGVDEINWKPESSFNSENPQNSPMLVLSSSSVLASRLSMKITPNNPSMKVFLKQPSKDKK